LYIAKIRGVKIAEISSLLFRPVLEIQCFEVGLGRCNGSYVRVSIYLTGVAEDTLHAFSNTEQTADDRTHLVDETAFHLIVTEGAGDMAGVLGRIASGKGVGFKLTLPTAKAGGFLGPRPLPTK
jgi:hypothetical protein